MAIIEINRNPSPRELRVFGLALVLFAGLVGAGFQWRAHAPGIARVVWLAGALVATGFFVLPRIRRPIYLAWMYATFPIGFVVSHLVLALVYYAVLTPTGLMKRLLGRDSMTRRFDPAAKSYWAEHDPHQDPGRYFRQF